MLQTVVLEVLRLQQLLSAAYTADTDAGGADDDAGADDVDDDHVILRSIR